MGNLLGICRLGCNVPVIKAYKSIQHSESLKQHIFSISVHNSLTVSPSLLCLQSCYFSQDLVDFLDYIISLP